MTGPTGLSRQSVRDGRNRGAGHALSKRAGVASPAGAATTAGGVIVCSFLIISSWSHEISIFIDFSQCLVKSLKLREKFTQRRVGFEISMCDVNVFYFEVRREWSVVDSSHTLCIRCSNFPDKVELTETFSTLYKVPDC